MRNYFGLNYDIDMEQVARNHNSFLDMLNAAFDLSVGSPCGKLMRTVNFNVKKVITNAPATIIYWADGTKTVVKCQEGDVYNPETGIAMCFMKHALGDSSRMFNDALAECMEMRWEPETKEK